MGASSNPDSVARFRAAWCGQRVPDWKEFARETRAHSLSELCEIVAIDLVQRWERAAAEGQASPEAAGEGGEGHDFPARPLLEDYLRAWPMLADAPPMSLCYCLAVEYAVRCRSGDRPSLQSYAERFAHLWPRLRRLLEESDRASAATKTADIPTMLFARARDGALDDASSIDACPVDASRSEARGERPPVTGSERGEHEVGGSESRADDADASPDQPTITYRAARDDTVNVPPGRGMGPKAFGEYELLEEIARGGMGVVYRARQIKADRIVALKMIRSGELADDEEIERFYMEARSAARLDHPGIVPVFDVGEFAGQHYFTMGYVDGPTLKAVVKDGPLPPRRAAEIARQIAEAVAYAHAQGVIHRDLKPSNVLIDADGQPRITDFGLAKQIEGNSNLTASGQVMGTPSYMPPEQAAGRIDRIGPHSDVYAVGAILYEMLTGRPPFTGVSTLELLTAVMEKDPEAPHVINPRVDRDLETICLKCLQKDPARRYATCSALASTIPNTFF